VSYLKISRDVNDLEIFNILFLKTDKGGYLLKPDMTYNLVDSSKIPSVYQLLNTPLLFNPLDQVIGSGDAKVTLNVFTDYDCINCKSFEENTQPKLIQEYVSTGKANLVFKDYIIHELSAVLPAIVTRCAQEQGKYLETQKLMFDLSGTIGSEGLVKNIIADHQSEIDKVNQEYQDVVSASNN
jgi:protein-disulfide isomerase